MDDELDFDPRKFIIATSVWHVVKTDSYDPVQDRTTDGVWYVVVFSDSDLAERFITRNHLDAIALEMPSPPKWLQFVGALINDGYEYIAIDPEPGQRIRIAPTRHIYNAIKDSIDRQRPS